MGTKQLLVVYAIKLALVLTVSRLAGLIIPYLGHFSFPDTLFQYHLPQFVKALANFDGIHYLLIAQKGYAQFQQAFFPLYPLMIRGVGKLLAENYLVAGLIISNTAFLAALYFLVKLAGKKRGGYLIGFLLAFPTGFFFHAGYTESLFLLWVVLSLLMLKKRHYLAAGFFGILASSTRLVGIFLVVPLLWDLYRNKKYRLLPLGVLPVVGLSLYMLYLWRSVGDPLAFFHSQSAFGAGRSTSLILLPQVYWRYLKIFLTADINLTYFVAALEAFTFTLVFLVCCLELLKQYKARNQYMVSIALFSLINLLLPTVTGTFLSIPRFVLPALSFFFYLSEINSARIKIALMAFFALGQALLLAFFVQGYFIS